MLFYLLIVIAIYWCYTIYDIADNFVEFLIWSAVAFLLCIFCGSMLLCGLGNLLTKHELDREDFHANIYSLKENSELHGSFYLGSGYIDSNSYFYTFTKNERGGYSRWKTREDSAIIYQDVKENEQPFVSWQKINYKSPNWLFPFNVFDCEITRYDIHVPANTIIEKYKVE